MKKASVLTGLVLFGAVCASAFALPRDKPFDQRYPVSSITSVSKAQSVISAYEKEMSALNKWKSAEEAKCNRGFLVTDCVNKVKKQYTEESRNARRVWLAARDFVRKDRADKAQAQRLKANEEHRKKTGEPVPESPEPEAYQSGITEKRSPVTSVPPSSAAGASALQQSPRTVKPESSGEALPEPRSVKSEDAAAYEQKIPQPRHVIEEGAPDLNPNSGMGKSSVSKEVPVRSSLTPEQEAANRKAYEEKQLKREKRIKEEEEKVPQASKTTPEERHQQLIERRKQAEAKRQENIKKRKEKALQYEELLKERQEQEHKVFDDYNPIIFK